LRDPKLFVPETVKCNRVSQVQGSRWLLEHIVFGGWREELSFPIRCLERCTEGTFYVFTVGTQISTQITSEFCCF